MSGARLWSRVTVVTAVAGSVAVAAAGCGSSSELGGGGGNGASSAGGAKGGTPSEVTVGALLPLAGPDAYFGHDAAAGAQIAVGQINAAGGVDGKVKLILKTVDNQNGTTPGNVAAIGNLISTASHLGMVFGYGAAANVALKPYMEQHDLVGFNAGSNASTLSALTPQWFNLAVLSPIEMHAFAEYLFRVKHFKTAGIIGQNDDIGQGQDWEGQFSKQFTAVGGKVVSTAMGAQSATTFQSEVSQVRSHKPQVVFIAAGQNAVPTIMTEVRSIGWKVQMTTDSNFAGDAAVFKSPAAQGLLSSGYQFSAPASFTKQYTKIVGKAAGPPYSAVGNYYDAVEIYTQALGDVIKHSESITGRNVADAIRKIGSFKSVDGGTVKIDAQGNTTRPVAVYQISNDTQKLVVANAAQAASGS